MHKTCIKKIFILGSGHCGSTLLDLLLDSHSDIIGLGEFQHLKEDTMCTCGHNVLDCVFWKNIFDVFSGQHSIYGQLYQKKKDFLFNIRNFFIYKNNQNILLDNIDIYRDNLLKFLFHIRELSRSKVIVSSTKNVYHTSLILESNYVDPIIIHLVRDGRAVVWSYYKKYKRFWPFAWKWLMENVKIEILKRRYRNVPYLLIRYEDLALQPKEVLKRILSAVNLYYEDSMVNFRDFLHHQIGGNRMRFKSSKEIVIDESWKQEMWYIYRILFCIFFGWLNLYYKKHRI